MAHEKRQAVFGEVGNDVFGREGLKVLFDGPELGEGAWCPSVLVAHGVIEDVDAVIYVGIGIVQHAAEVSAKLMLGGVRQGGATFEAVLSEYVGDESLDGGELAVDVGADGDATAV